MLIDVVAAGQLLDGIPVGCAAATIGRILSTSSATGSVPSSIGVAVSFLVWHRIPSS